MITTKAKSNRNFQYSPSINIERDLSRNLNYITTKNATEAFDTIINDYKIGIRAFNLIGAYGTGKSAFLLGFQKTLLGKENYFRSSKNSFSGYINFDFLNITGQFSSFTDTIASEFGFGKKRDYSSREIIKAVEAHAKKVNKSDKICVIVVDEFGKFLEYAAKNNAEKELYLIQLLAELANDESKEILFLTTLHQDFNGYSRDLTKSQQNEWDKVKGRLKEIPFNEPIEQLLYLGAGRMSQLELKTSNANFEKLFNSIGKANIFPLSDFNTLNFAKKLLPFDILSAAVMTISLQKYGQNERSLFAFLESNDPLGIRSFDTKQATYYSLAYVYDYLVFNFFNYLNNSSNPDKPHWFAMRTAIERCQGLMGANALDGIKLIKTIGLLNLFGSTSGRLNGEFLEAYAKYSLTMKNSKEILQILLKHKIIRFQNFNQRFVLFEGTDVDIDWVINEAGNLIEEVSNVVHHLDQYFEAGLIPAKGVYYEKGTPRFFQFLLSDQVEISKVPEGEIDGYVNLIFSSKINENELRQKTAQCQEAILFGLFANSSEIAKEVYNIERIKKAIDLHRDDAVAVRVLQGIKQNHIKLLNYYISGSVYSNNRNIIWYYRGNRVTTISDRKSFNQELSRICNQVYSETPVYKNEMLNKTNYHSVIAKARRDLISRLLNQYYLKNLGYRSDEFPPDKSIYLSLVQNTGIHKEQDDFFTLGEPTSRNLQSLWQASINFLDSTKQGKRNLKELINTLEKRPYKLKQGLIDFWLPIFLIIKKDDYALFYDESFLADISDDTLDLITKSPQKYEIKAFQVEGVRLDLFNKYRGLINKEESDKLRVRTFIDTILPFLNFYKSLTPFAQQTKQVSINARRFRDAIITSKDPETAFFEKFPEAFGHTFSQLRKTEREMRSYILEIKDAIKELRVIYFDLLDKFENLIINETVGKKCAFNEYKLILQDRFSSLKEHLLTPIQKKLYNQIFSPIDDRETWLNAVAQACIDKRLDQFNDNDEKLLHEKFIYYLHQLDNLCELSLNDIDYANEDLIKLEITSFVENINGRIIRMPKSKSQEAARMAEFLSDKLSKDKQLNIVTLINLLKDQLTDE